MTTSRPPSPGPRPVTGTAPRTPPRLLSRALLQRFVSIIGASTSFYLLLSVVPLYAHGAGGNAAGLVTGALMAATVLGELATPRLVGRWGYRRVLAAGLVLLGAPALALPLSPAVPWVVAVCLVRGLGFAFTVVAGGALTASLIPAERRGEGLALVGVVGGVPALVALPLGVWLSAHVGYGPVFAGAAVAALAAVASLPGLPGVAGPPGPESAEDRAIGMVAALRNGTLMRPAVVFFATAMGAGIIVTFLPLAVVAGSGGLAALALLVQTAAATLGRWLAGRHGDRHGPAGQLAPGVLLAAVGLLVLAFVRSPVAVVTGAVLFGLGFGVSQNASLSLMYARVSGSAYGAVSALWNLAYDAGMGAGALAFGVVAPHTGFPVSFALAAVPVLAVVPMARVIMRPDGRRRPATPAPVPALPTPVAGCAAVG
jgi:predicted MFS family arabinose efflux permease